MRGFISGTLGKKLKLKVESFKTDKGDRTYRVKGCRISPVSTPAPAPKPAPFLLQNAPQKQAKLSGKLSGSTPKLPVAASTALANPKPIACNASDVTDR